MNDETPKLPSFATMVKNFVKSSVEYIAEGMPAVSPEVYKTRMEACQKCELRIAKDDRCSLCGCYVFHKGQWATADCPDNPSRWKVAELELKKKSDNVTDL
jgi:hypothetical protein